ncbi:MAG: hypothetical protein ACYDCL_04235 [Myxococcales bacterium]
MPVIAFVQDVGGNAGYPPAAPSLTLTLPSASGAGNLIVVSVGWGGSVGSLSVSDSQGNQYASAVGPTSWSSGWEGQVFYAPGVKAGVDTITVTAPATPQHFLEGRAFEYAGLDPVAPLDATSAATGVGCQSSLGAGAGFTARPVDGGGGCLAEDRVAAQAGAYDATELCGGVATLDSGPASIPGGNELLFGVGQAAVSGAYDWDMQLAAFRGRDAG